MLKLIIKQKGRIIQVVPLQGDVQYTIGRGKDNQIVLPEQPGISRKHLEFSLGEDQEWSVKNLSQTSQLIIEGEDNNEGIVPEGGVFQIQDFEFLLQKEKVSKTSEADEALVAQTVNPNENTEQQANNVNPSESNPLDKEIHSNPLPPTAPDGKTKIVDVSSQAQQISAYLKVSYEEDTPRDIFKLEGQSEWIFGRDEEADIIVDNANISREHFKIHRDNDGQFYICDLKSSNGTILNNKDLRPNKPYLIQSGDIIYIMDIEILFEIKNLSLEKELAGLKVPAPSTPTQHQVPATPGAIPSPYMMSPMPANMPGVVIEMPEEEKQSFLKKNKKRLMIYGTVLIILGAVYFLNTEEKEKKVVKKEVSQTGELAGLTPQQIQIVKDTYQVAQQLYSQGKFEYCKSEVKKIHNYTDSYLQSKKLGVECAQAAENQRIQNDLEQKRKKAEETEKNIQKITDKCDKEFDTFKFKHELVDCLQEAIELSPADGRIQGLIERFDAIEMEKEEKKRQIAERKQFINSIVSKYNYAKKLYTDGKLLKAMDAYQRFINASSHKELKAKRAQAQRELAAMKKNFNDTNNKLNNKCEAQFNSNRFQKAYYACKQASNKIPEPHNKIAISFMHKSRQKLEIVMKPLYEEASLNESVGNINVAQEYWKKILSLDVSSGMYYKMAKEKMDKY